MIKLTISKKNSAAIVDPKAIFISTLFVLSFFGNTLAQTVGDLAREKYEPCTTEFYEMIARIENGDTTILRNFLESGGDPMYRCLLDTTINDTYMWGLLAIEQAVSIPPNFEKYKIFFSSDLPQEQRDYYFAQYLYPDSDSAEILARILVKNGARLTHFLDIARATDGRAFIDRLNSWGYDFNGPTGNGDNTFTLIAAADESVDPEVIRAALQRMVELCVRFYWINFDGKGAADVAQVPGTRRFCKRNFSKWYNYQKQQCGRFKN